MWNRKSSGVPGIAFDRGRNKPAGLNIAAVDALNDRAVRKLSV